MMARHALRRPKRRRNLALRWTRQALRNFPRKGRGNNSVSRLLARRRGNDGRVFLQVPADQAVTSGAGR